MLSAPQHSPKNVSWAWHISVNESHLPLSSLLSLHLVKTQDVLIRCLLNLITKNRGKTFCSMLLVPNIRRIPSVDLPPALKPGLVTPDYTWFFKTD